MRKNIALTVSNVRANTPHQKLSQQLEPAFGLGTWTWDLEDNIFNFTDNCAIMLGYDPVEMNTFSGTTKKYYSPESHKQLVKDYDKWLTEGGKDTFEGKYLLLDANNEEHWFLETAYVVARNEKSIPTLLKGMWLNLDSNIRRNQVISNNTVFVSDDKSLNNSIPELYDANSLILNTMPFACVLLDENFSPVMCNLKTIKLTGSANEREALEKIVHLHPEIQPDGSNSIESFQIYCVEALQNGSVTFPWTIKLADKILIPCEITMIRVKVNSRIQIAFLLNDLRSSFIDEDDEKSREELAIIMLNTSPLASCICTEEYEIADCNEAALRLFGAKNKETVLDSFYQKFSPKFQPDGRLSKEKAKEYLDVALDKGHATFDWLHQNSLGELIPVKVTLSRMPWRGTFVVSSYAQDLRAIKAAEREASLRSTYLRTINTVAGWLLETSDHRSEGAIMKSLEFLTTTLNITSAKIWTNHDLNGEPYYQLYKSYPANCAKHWTGTYAYNKYPHLKDSMFDNRIINSFVDDLPRNLRTLLSDKGIKSILILPLDVGGKQWGFITFEDYENEHLFTEVEEQMLNSASILIASNIVRTTSARQILLNNIELRKKSLLLSSVNRVAELILGSEQKDFPLVVQRALKLMGESIKAVRSSMWLIDSSKENKPIAKRFTGWNKGETFEAANIDIEIDLFEYMPKWNTAINQLEDIERVVTATDKTCQILNLVKGKDTMLMIPLVISEKFWGFAGFVFDNPRHHSTEEERSIIHSGSRMIAEALNKLDVMETLALTRRTADTDQLTGLLTRNGFLPNAAKLLNECSEKKSPYTILFMDIDHFKSVNDRFGHGFGDRVISRFGEITRHTVRPTDLCCRYGGEEVVVVLANQPHEIVMKVANRLLDNFRKARFEDNEEFSFTVSIGVYSKIPNIKDQLSEFLEKADMALYAAKENGRDQIVEYSLALEE